MKVFVAASYSSQVNYKTGEVILAHKAENKLTYFNAAMVKAGVVYEVELPLNEQSLEHLLT